MFMQMFLKHLLLNICKMFSDVTFEFESSDWTL